MPALALMIDGVLVATVNTDGYDIVDVRVHGTCVEKNVATLDFSAGAHPQGGSSTYLTWVNDLTIEPKQSIKITFLEDGLTSHDGKTIDELFPDEVDKEPVNFKPWPDAIKDIRAMTRFRNQAFFKVKLPQNSIFNGALPVDSHGFAFSVLWNAWHPERISVSLHTYTLENLELRSNGDYLLTEKISVNSAIEFEVDV